MRYRIGVDIGGTFTDLVCFDGESNTFSVVKVLTDIKNPVRSVIRAIEYADIDLETIIHATTLGTNIFLGQEGLKKPKLALITTKGFRDVIEIGRQRRPKLYDLFFEKLKPIVLRRDRYEVRERIDSQGNVIIPIDEEEMKRIAAEICKKRYDVVAIVFLHSYKNSVHEFRTKKIIRDVCRELDIVISYEIDPEYKEYERASTTVVNAFLRPMMSKYFKRSHR